MIYKAKKQVYNSKGNEVETSYFDVPGSFIEELVGLLMDEGYNFIYHEDNYIMLSKIFTQHDENFYSRFQFRKVYHA